MSFMRKTNYVCHVCSRLIYVRPRQIQRDATHCCSRICDAIIRSMKRKIDPNTRFWQKVFKAPDGCWYWQGSRDTKDYGVFILNTNKTQGIRDRRYAHRFVWELLHGTIPNNLCVLHRCDNPPCVNPDHLFLGTRGDNIKDMLRKHRHPKMMLTDRCCRDHMWTKENTYIRPNGYRTCRTCIHIRRHRSTIRKSISSLNDCHIT